MRIVFIQEVPRAHEKIVLWAYLTASKRKTPRL